MTKTPQEMVCEIIAAMPGTEPSRRRKAANLLGVSWPTVWRWEHGTRPIRGGNVTAIKLIWEQVCAPKRRTKPAGKTDANLGR